MSTCPYCSNSLAIVDARIAKEDEKFRPVRTEFFYLCPFCEKRLRPRRMWLSRAVLVLGVIAFPVAGVFVAKLVGQFARSVFGSISNQIFTAILIGVPVFGILATLYVAKAIVRYDKNGS